MIWEYLLFNDSKVDRKTLNVVNTSVKKVLETKTLKKVFREKNIKNFSFAIVLVEKTVARKLNKFWRDKNKIPDILSFPVLEIDKKQKILGDIFLTTDKIIKDSKGDIKLTFQKLIAHGLLHLMGFDHIKDSDYATMDEIENKIFQELIKN